MDSQMLQSGIAERLPRSEYDFDVMAKMYDTMGKEYEDYILEDEGRMRCLHWILQELALRESSGTLEARYLVDLGCASGRPTVQALAEGLQKQRKALSSQTSDEVIGIDLSPGQLEIARSQCDMPGVRFELADLREWEPPANQLPKGCHAVTSFYVLNHLPFEDYGAAINRMASWLKPGGLMALGVVAGVNGKVHGWFGFEVTTTSVPLPETVKLVEASGCEVLKFYEEEWKSQGRPDSRPKVNQFIWARKT
ncbi:MAG: hypothetical protein M1820_003674 [Bogoriella megaspora]|nr:MAG: hypothetical protein M1820_003674 [Bogoriella megaspora]